MSKKNKSNSPGFIAGVVVGAVAAYLLTGYLSKGGAAPTDTTGNTAGGGATLPPASSYGGMKKRPLPDQGGTILIRGRINRRANIVPANYMLY